tara:strand:- start:42 stop:500 length:459 start_codon:yes stop_codon:yes gene_type:complete
MFDNPRQRQEFDTAEALSDLLPEIKPAPQAHIAAQPEARGFELPGRIWLGMISCYALFLASMIAALGSSGKAMLSIAVSIVYVVVFFAVARIVIAQNPDRDVSPLDRNGFLMTHFGPMDRKAVYGQVLVVPAAIAFFGVAVSEIIVLTGKPA